MATFPSLQALSRSYSLNGRTSSVYETERSRVQITFINGSTPTNRVFRIGFPLITEADAEAISSHYTGEKQHGRFSIPATIWQSHPNLYDVTPANQLYRYLSPPSRTYANGLYDVTIEITSVL
jgi:hypothetical protein